MIGCRSAPAHQPDRRSRCASRFALPLASLLLLLLVAPSCRPADDPGAELDPLQSFCARVGALVTTSVRGRLRDDPAAAARLRSAGGALREQPTVADLLAALRTTTERPELASAVEADLRFELSKPEHAEVRAAYSTPRVQREVVLAVVQGIERALTQLEPPRE